MSTSAASPTTNNTLTDQLAAARERVAACEKDLGAAIVDNRGVQKRTEALEHAKAEVHRLELGLGELERREAEAEKQATEDAERQERVDVYRSIVAWLPKVQAYVEARAALDQAEDELRSNVPHELVRSVKNNVLTWGDRRLAAYDKRLIGGLPKVPTHSSTVPMPDPTRFTPELLAELAARATELAEAEERGESIAITPGELRKRGERRRRIEIAERKRGPHG